MSDFKKSVEPIILPKDNLFFNGEQIIFNSGEGKLTREKIAYTGKTNDEYYTVKNSDTITSIAYKKYKDKVERPSHYWWVIADANNIFNPLDLSSYVGDEILIPDILNFQLNNQ